MNLTDTLTATVRIAAAPAEVFPYLVEPQLFVQWIGNLADLNPVPGGVFALDFGDTGDTKVRGNFVSVEPPNRVVFTWGIPGSDSFPAGSSTVEILLKADGDETIVELFHRDLPANEVASHLAGWNSLLDGLRKVAGS
jgi:uncharacterized protein YndB with AHSA1/START domain